MPVHEFENILVVLSNWGALGVGAVQWEETTSLHCFAAFPEYLLQIIRIATFCELHILVKDSLAYKPGQIAFLLSFLKLADSALRALEPCDLYCNATRSQ